jgi:hypothetical protein
MVMTQSRKQPFADLPRLYGMGEPGTVKVALADTHDLGLPLETTECSGMDNAGLIAFVWIAVIIRTGWVPMETFTKLQVDNF